MTHYSDSRNKEVAYGRIKRLASSGLPLEPFVRGIFELINDGVPHSPNRVFHVGTPDQIEAYIFSAPHIAELAPIQRHYFTDSTPEMCGVRFPYNAYAFRNVLPSKTIWEQHDLALPNLYRSDGFNAVYRPLGWHHVIQVVYQEAGEYLGYYPIWRTIDQKPFSREDAEFLRASAPHIAHGIKAAKLLARNTSAHTELFAPLPTWGSGVILMDVAGKLIAIDQTARLTFQQLGVFDGLRGDAFASRLVKQAVDYVTRALKTIFRDAGAPSAAAPVSWVRSHWTGMVLRLRGVIMPGADGNDYINVLVERGETASSRRARAMVRWGLSAREAQVLAFIVGGKRGPEIAILLGISHDTVRKHTSRILDKLGVETRAAAAFLAREFVDTVAAPLLTFAKA